jgi:hypothetical protein
MLNRFLARMFRGRPAARPQRSRLSLEQLEDRLVLSGTPSAVGTQTQALTNPSIDGNGATRQYIPAGNYLTVASQTVTVDAATQTGQFKLAFQAQAWSGVSNRVGVRYLIDSQLDANDAVVRSGTSSDAIEDIGSNGWQSLYLNRLITLAPGTHTIVVQVFANNEGIDATQSLSICSVSLNLTGFNTADGQHTADGVLTQALTSPASGRSGQQDITAGSWQTVTSQSVTVGPNKTGVYDLAFQAQARAIMRDHIAVRYLIDGKIDPSDVALTSIGTGADTSEDFSAGNGWGDWHTLLLLHELALTPGNHTISIQVQSDTTVSETANLTVYTPTLSLIGYNLVDGVRGAGGLQTQLPASAVNTAPGQQNLTAGSWQTVASQSVSIVGPRTGLYDFGFQAQALSQFANRVYVRYLIDGQPDPNDLAVAQSSSEADAVVDFNDYTVADSWHSLFLAQLLSLTPGNHIVSVQVYSTTPSPNDQPDLVVAAPTMHLMGFNNVSMSVTPGNPSTFSYDPASHVLTVNGRATVDQFKFTQMTQSAADGTLSTLYTVTMNGSSLTYNSSQLAAIVVKGYGGRNSAQLFTNDTYVGADGLTHETPEQISMAPGGAILQKLDGNGSPYNFLQLMGFTNIRANMGHADSAQLHDSQNNDTFVTVGLTSTMTGFGYKEYVHGAGSVTGFSTTGHDIAYQYDGSGPSTFTATGVTSSTMTGTDQGQSFTNTALGFKYNYGIGRHKGDIANLYDSPGNDVFVAVGTVSSLYSATNRGAYTMFNQATGFGHVNAFSTAGGTDLSYNHAPGLNSVSGFKRVFG